MVLLVNMALLGGSMESGARWRGLEVRLILSDEECSQRPSDDEDLIGRAACQWTKQVNGSNCTCCEW